MEFEFQVFGFSKDWTTTSDCDCEIGQLHTLYVVPSNIFLFKQQKREQLSSKLVPQKSSYRF